MTEKTHLVNHFKWAERMADEPRSQQDIEREKRHQRIIDVARRHMEKFGYKRTVIDDIVQDVGIAKGTFYLHFGSKRELLLAVIDDLQRQSLRAYQEMVQEELTPAELVQKTLKWVAEVMKSQPLAERLLILDGEHWLVKTLMTREQMQQQMEGSLGFFRNLVVEGIEAGEFREDIDLELSPWMFGAAKVLFANRHTATLGMIDVDYFIEGVMDMVMRYLMKPGVAIGEKVEARRSRSYDLTNE